VAFWGVRKAFFFGKKKQKTFVLAWLITTPAGAQAFLTTPNQPLAGPLPVIVGAQLGDGIQLAYGARPAFTLVLGTAQEGANITTAQAVRDRFFLNTMTGDLTRAIGSPMDTGQADNATFAAVARHTAPGAPGDLHAMAPDGLHLRAACAAGGRDCTPGHIWAAMIRIPFAWRPGMVLKVRYRSPAGEHSWAPIWMYSGEQTSPGPGGDPYSGYNTPAALYRPGHPNIEIDWNDNYPRTKAGVRPGFQIDFGTPDIYGTKWQIPPHAMYRAQGSGWRYFDASFRPDFQAAPFDWSAGFHDLVGNWRGDGSNLLDLIVDGKLVATQYMEYPQDTYADPVDGVRRKIGMHLMIGNQAVPSFSPDAAHVRDNDGLADGWTMVVQEIAGWYGNVENPDALRASQTSAVGPAR